MTSATGPVAPYVRMSTSLANRASEFTESSNANFGSSVRTVILASPEKSIVRVRDWSAAGWAPSLSRAHSFQMRGYESLYVNFLEFGAVWGSTPRLSPNSRSCSSEMEWLLRRVVVLYMLGLPRNGQKFSSMNSLTSERIVSDLAA